MLELVIFIFTDNSTVESAVAKGNFPSRRLFELVKELKLLQMIYCFVLYVIYMAGTRIIQQGTNGVSHGELKGGAILGQPIRDFAPLHLSALERNKFLKKWLESWVGPNPFFLNLEHWYSEVHDIRYIKNEQRMQSLSYETRIYIWSPPPAIVDPVLE